MIIQSLVSYYDRAVAAGSAPPYGYQYQAVSVVLDLANDGEVIASSVLGVKDRLNLVVPAWPVRANNITSSYLCDNATYALGLIPEGKDAAYAAVRRAAWVDHHEVLVASASDPALKAFLTHVETWTSKNLASIEGISKAPDGAAVAYRYNGQWVHDVEEARSIWAAQRGGEIGLCLITGQREALAANHRQIRGVKASTRSTPVRAALVSYNDRAFEHWGRKGNDNAPVSDVAAHAYATAVETLIQRGNVVHYGGASHVYWTDAIGQEALDAEELLRLAFGDASTEERQAAVDPKVEEAKLAVALATYVRGLKAWEHPEAPYHILSIEPGTGRHAVRSYQRSTIGALRDAVCRHVDQIEIGSGPVPNIATLLASAVRDPKDDVVPNPVARDYVSAVTTGTPYPATLINRVLTRIYAGQDVTLTQAALLKGFLIRNHNREINVSLNPENPSVAYQLGRLLASAERIQLAGNPDISVTVRDRYIRLISARPAEAVAAISSNIPVWVRSIRSRVSAGLAVNLDAEHVAILARLAAIPARLTIEQQAELAVGYAQQRVAYDEARAVAKAAKSEDKNI